ncbi:SGNH/GDSL hydrolase family protein [Mucilaginibacter sp.]|jgi:lysophospholipase L1-like esterase|uniref:SGNH/GDSL hydrolase family protein n=1 Tax=Mucilaginibacter sp. TaxID=1882438 RepID=UPI00356657DE
MKKISFLVLFIAQTLFCLGQKADSSNYLNNIKDELNKVWPNNRTINLVFHGHSVPAGYRANHEVNILESYPNLLLKKLKAQYPYAVINVIVTAIGGETSVKGQARFDTDVLPHKPDVLFIDYALNDRNIGLEAAKAAWEKMIKDALKHHVKVVLLTPSPDTRVNMLATDDKSLQAHAEQIKALAEKYHVGLSDSFSVFQNMVRSGGSITPYMAYVNHPNLAGHEIITNEIFKWFNK